MPIIQTNVFICEHCGKTAMISSNDVGLYGDYTLVPPDGWDYGYMESDKELFLCPDCMKKANQNDID